MTDETPVGDGEPDEWVPPMWPRYVGVAALSAIVVGCVVLIFIGVVAVSGGGEATDFFALILGGVGLWYVGNELRAALVRLRAARADIR